MKMESFYIIATPIGNLEDITLRALRILKEVDLIACEDTRVTTKLLTKYGIKKKLITYNDHSNQETRRYIVSLLELGNKIALVSDAGTPLISDPGYKLLQEIFQAGYKVTSIPGASSIITALTIAQLPTDKFFFYGYLPNKTIARKNALLEIKHYPMTIICFESPNRLIDTLTDINNVLGNRMITIARELTKLYEEILHDNAENLINKLQNINIKGEIVITIAGYETVSISSELINIELIEYLQKYSLKDTVQMMHEQYKISKKILYDLAKKITNQ